MYSWLQSYYGSQVGYLRLVHEKIPIILLIFLNISALLLGLLVAIALIELSS